jgi:hypothetical protein
MTNNKQQTAVEWLRQTLRHTSVSIFSGDIADQAKNLEQVFQQAKEMEKDRMMQFARYVLWKTVATMELTIEQHYEQTYGEDNHSENLEQWAWDNPCLSRSDVYNLFEEVFKTKRLTFDKTYAIGASKEVSDFQNKLRKLAKDKSELLQKSI